MNQSQWDRIDVQLNFIENQIRATRELLGEAPGHKRTKHTNADLGTLYKRLYTVTERAQLAQANLFENVSSD